ncbi:hypothetical protein VKT23_014307 [Stygiomarasmius scandens]|uniref:DUF6532 domain-containing protein n=1 Tax=Marasmiellus scandens TaxID=2682957 RepID=A0ABR1J4K6_9AGAR
MSDSSQPPKPLETRGVKREAEKEEAKAKKLAAVKKKKTEQAKAGARIAAFEDAQVETVTNRLAIDPDIAEEAPQPVAASKRGSNRGRGGRGSRGGRDVAVILASLTNAKGARSGARGTRSTRGSARGSSCGNARGGAHSARTGSASIGGGKNRETVEWSPERTDSDVMTDTTGEGDTYQHPPEVVNDFGRPMSAMSDVDELGRLMSAMSDVDMPPATEMDTESNGAVDIDRNEKTEEEGEEAEDDGQGHGPEMLDIGELSDDDDDYQNDEDDEEEGAEDVEPAFKGVKKSKPKKNKHAIRQGINASCTVPPQQLVHPLKNSKRCGSNVENGQAKKRTKAPLGGLDKDYKSVYGMNSAALSSSSVMSVKTSSSEGVVGEFDVDEMAESVNASRERKGAGGTVKTPAGFRQVTDIALVSANVAEIDRKDHVKNPSSSKRTITSSKNLPFTHFSDKQVWENSFLPCMYQWQGTLKDQFSSSSHVDFSKILGTNWQECYKHLEPTYQDLSGITHQRVNHPTIRAVTQTALSVYRSDFANKKALVYVEQKMNEEVPVEDGVNLTEARKEWVQQQLQGMLILYENPGDPKTNTPPSGLFKSEVFSKTLAYHLYKIRDSRKYVWYGNPVGAMALCAAAIKRALTIWQDGIKPKLKSEDDNEENDKKLKQAARNSPISFSQAHWGGAVTNLYEKYTSKLSDSKCEEIVVYAEYYLPESLKALLWAQEAAEDDELIMSD